MSELEQKIKSAIKQAMVNKEKDKLVVLRTLSAALKQIEIDKKINLTDEIVLNELIRQVKLRQEAINQFISANRSDLIAKEQQEIDIIRQFLPEQLSVEAMQKAIDEIILQSGLPLQKSSMSGLMTAIKNQLNGQIDIAKASSYIKEKLN